MGDTRRILIVDHEPRAAVDMRRVLQSAGYEVLEAPTGKECLTLARQKRPHLILIDDALSDISGIDLVRQIRRDMELSQAYVALLIRDGTASAIQARALEVGADALIVRGLLTREFLSRVEALLRRQAAEESVRTALQDYRATFDAMSDAVYLVNLEHKIIDCNLAMARLLAKPRGDIVGGRCYELVHGSTSPLPACVGQRVRESRRRETLVVPMDDRWLQVDVDPLLDANGAVIGSVHVLRDITERRRMEEALQQTQAELELRAAEHHLALDKAHRDLQAEQEARERTQEVLKGIQADLELRTREYEQLLQTHQGTEHNLQRVQRELQAIATQAADLVYTWEVQTGQVHLLSDAQGRFAAGAGGFPATLGELQRMIHPGDRAAVAEALAQHVADGTPWSGEYRVVQPDGQVARWAVSVAPLVRDAAGQEWMAVVRDVTAVRLAEAEQELARARLHQTQKMDALRRLALGAANEFNRLLARIVGQLTLILARIEPSHPLYSDLQAIVKVAQLGVALIRQLLAFAGRELLQLEELDVNALLQKLEPELRRVLGKGVEMQWALAAGLRPVLADARALHDVWLDLAAHVARAMPQGGVLRVHTAGVTLTDAYVRARPAVAAGHYVRVTMACRGASPPEPVPEDVFELRLASTDGAAGDELGLGVVYGLVQQMGGFIEVTQTEEETVWEVYLPACGSPSGEEQGGEGAVPQEGGGAEEWEGLHAEASAAAPEAAGVEAGAMAAAAAPAAQEPESATPQPVSAAPAEAELAGAGAQLPAWLTAEPPTGDITEPLPASPVTAAEGGSDITTSQPGLTDTREEPPCDITEEQPAAKPSGGLSSLRSRLRSLRRRN